MNGKEERKTCNRIIMAINAVRPLTPSERKADLVYGIALAILGIFFPLFSIPWLLTIGKPLTALAVNVLSIGIAAFIGLSRRKKILRSFYLTENAHELVTVETGDDMISELLDTDEVLLSLLPQEDAYLDVLYNWLCWRKLLEPGEEVTWYSVGSSTLAPYLREDSGLPERTSVLLMRFPGRLPDDAGRFYAEKGTLGVTLLNDVKK